MKKNRFKILLGLMSVALLGLLLLQFYWIKNVHQMTMDRVDEKIQQSIVKTVEDLEKIEMEPLLQEELFKQGLQGTYADYVNSEFGDIMQVDESIQIRDTAIVRNGETYQFLVVAGTIMDTATGLLAEHRVITKKLGDIIPSDVDSGILSFQDSNSYAIQVSNSFNRQILRKAQFMNEMAVKMFTGNYFDDLSFRLNLYVLDSLLSRNFRLVGLDTSFTFNIVGQSDEVTNFVHTTNHFNPELMTSPYKTLLYPNDVVSNNYNTHELLVSFPGQRAFLWREMTGTLIASVLLVLIIVFAFYLSVSTIYKQKQLSEIKNDFISNMTHELKTPISTIALACEAIQDPDVGEDVNTVTSFVEMIDQENKRLAKLVENVLQTALLEKGKMNLKLTDVKVDNLVREIVQAFQIRFKNRSGEIHIGQLDEVDTKVDRIHFGNVIYNLLDNALKYCEIEPKVYVNLKKTSKGFELNVKDNGIGIKKDDQKRIFEKLYRVPTGDVHNVKGFGLGLNYVYSIIQLHQGKIAVESALGKGSTFKINIENE